jgi:hypothetical protein
LKFPNLSLLNFIFSLLEQENMSEGNQMDQQQVSSNMAGIQLSKNQVQDQPGQENEQVPRKCASNLEPVA